MSDRFQITLPLADYRAEHVALEVSGKVATLTLNRPERKNPLTFQSYAELRDVFRALQYEEEVAAIVLAGAGGNFSSGGDVYEIIEPLLSRDMKGLVEFTQMTGDLVKAMRACPQPIVAAVEGVCAGAGAILAMASDLRLGTADARIAFLFNRVGLAGCDMGACAMLPRIIGQGRASELLFTGRAMTAEEAERWGFLNRTVASDALLAEAQQLAQKLAAGPTFANAMTKKMLHLEWSMGVDEAIDQEALTQALLMKTDDFRVAFEAFAGKSKPRFGGR